MKNNPTVFTEIDELRKKLDDHEKRILKLEKIIKKI